MLGLINKVQMFQIAAKKLNNMQQDRRGNEPVFSLSQPGAKDGKMDFSKYFDAPK